MTLMRFDKNEACLYEALCFKQNYYIIMIAKTQFIVKIGKVCQTV